MEVPRPPPRSGIASWLPTRFEVGELDIGRARLHFRSQRGVEIASLQDTALDIYPDGAGWAIDGKGGLLSVSKLPPLKVVSFRSRTQGDMFFLTNGEFRLGEAGKISASGEFGDNSKLRVEWSQVDVDPFLRGAMALAPLRRLSWHRFDRMARIRDHRREGGRKFSADRWRRRKYRDA